MPRAEPEYTDIAKGLSHEIWSAEITSKKLNSIIRVLIYIAGILTFFLALLLILSLLL